MLAVRVCLVAQPLLAQCLAHVTAAGPLATRKDWAKVEGDRLRALVAYIRANTRKNGVGARRGGAKISVTLRDRLVRVFVSVPTRVPVSIVARRGARHPHVATLKRLVKLRAAEAEDDAGGNVETIKVDSDLEEPLEEAPAASVEELPCLGEAGDEEVSPSSGSDEDTFHACIADRKGPLVKYTPPFLLELQKFRLSTAAPVSIMEQDDLMRVLKPPRKPQSKAKAASESAPKGAVGHSAAASQHAGSGSAEKGAAKRCSAIMLSAL